MKPQLWAVDPSGHGNVTDSHVRWRDTAQVPANPSPVVFDHGIYMVSDQGVLSCVDIANGKERFKSRLGGNYSASPIATPDQIYFWSEEGETIVIRPGTTFQELARNKLEGRLWRLRPSRGGRCSCAPIRICIALSKAGTPPPRESVSQQIAATGSNGFRGAHVNGNTRSVTRVGSTCRNAIAGNSVASATSQLGSRSPNCSNARAPFSRELRGRIAGRGIFRCRDRSDVLDRQRQFGGTRQAEDLRGEAVPTCLAAARKMERPPRARAETLAARWPPAG